MLQRRTTQHSSGIGNHATGRQGQGIDTIGRLNSFHRLPFTGVIGDIALQSTGNLSAFKSQRNNYFMIRRVDGYNRVTVVTIFIARHHIALFEIILRRDALASYRDVTGEVAEHLATLGHFIVHAVLFNVNQPLGGSAIRYSTCPPHNRPVLASHKKRWNFFAHFKPLVMVAS